MKRNLLLLSALLTIGYVKADAPCPATGNSVNTLPGWDAAQTFPCSFAGTIEASRSTGTSHNLFYWLFKNQSLPQTAPLIIWLQG